MSGRVRFPASAFLVLVAAAASANDSVTLVTGRKLEGTILTRDDTGLTLRTSFGDVDLRTDQISKIESGPPPKPPAEKKDAAAKPAEGAAVKEVAKTAAEAPSKAPAKPEPTPAEVEALCKRLVADMAAKNPAQRAIAVDEIAVGWPTCAAALDASLASADERVRLEAVRLLGRGELGDQHERLAKALMDPDTAVRQAAVRVARHNGDWPGVEGMLVRVMTTDRTWQVRQEAIRGLEDIGTTACLREVLREWESEHEQERRARYRRVLVRVLGQELGESAEAWQEAVDAAISAAGKKRQSR